MLTRLAMRIAQGVLVIVVAASAAFALLHLAPGDPFSNADSDLTRPASVRATLRAQRGLDLPLTQQYARWIGNYARGDFGWSTSQQRPVADALRLAVPRTLFLMSAALIASLTLGVALGAWQGVRAGSRGDRATSLLTLVLVSCPEFWFGMLLLLVFAQWLAWLPAGGFTDELADHLSSSGQIVDRVRHFVLPWLALTALGTAVIARYQRAEMREVFALPFVRTARAKGLTERQVRGHALRAALLPVIGLAGLLLPSLLAGAVFVERIFAWPGMGLTLLQGLGKRDYDLIAACVVIGSALTALGSLMADVLSQVADPRTRPS